MEMDYPIVTYTRISPNQSSRIGNKTRKRLSHKAA